MKNFTKTVIGLFIMSVCLMANAVTLRKGHPMRYEVKRGDTLWTIAGKFLNDPAEWPLLMHANPSIHNPDKIYPGEILEVEIINGQPAMRVLSGGTVKLSPHVRSEPLNDAIPSIPYEVVAPFLSDTRIVNQEVFAKAPSVVAYVGEHIAVGAGDQIYVDGLHDDLLVLDPKYSIFRLGDVLTDPDTHEVLGYEASHVGDLEVLRAGEPVTALVIEANREVLVGDHVLPVEPIELQKSFALSLPDPSIEGKIINVLDGITQIGQYQVVVINRGHVQGVKLGDVFSVYTPGKVIPDPHAENRRRGKQATIQLPDVHAGQLMVFRVFDQVSFGVVMRAKRSIHLLDKVRNPEVG
jgi:hypothetical protein